MPHSSTNHPENQCTPDTLALHDTIVTYIDCSFFIMDSLNALLQHDEITDLETAYGSTHVIAYLKQSAAELKQQSQTLLTGSNDTHTQEK